MATKNAVAVAPQAENLPALHGFALLEHGAETIAEVLRENVGPGGLTIQTLPRLKVPAAGVTQWEIVDEETGNSKYVPIVSGIILAHVKQRVYWPKSFDETGPGVPPQCSSPDSVQGHGDPGVRCANCKFAQYGSATPKPGKDIGRGQACQQRYMLFIMERESVLPTVISAPPTSIKPMTLYMTALAQKAYFHHAVVTDFGLEKVTNQDSIPYAALRPRAAKVLSLEERAALAPIVKMIKAAVTTTVDLDSFERVDDDGVVHSGGPRTGGGPAAADADGEIAY